MNRNSIFSGCAAALLAFAAMPGLAQTGGSDKGGGVRRDFCKAGNPVSSIAYPPSAVEARRTGAVVLKSLLDENGMVDEVTVVKSSGTDALDEAAIAAAKASPIYCTEGYSSEVFYDAYYFDIVKKKSNLRILSTTQIGREIYPWDRRDDADRKRNECRMEIQGGIDYPRDVLFQKIEGTVTLEVQLDSSDRPRQVTITDGSGDSRLDAAAGKTARGAKYICPAGVTRRVATADFRYFLGAVPVSRESSAGGVAIQTHAYQTSYSSPSLW